MGRLNELRRFQLNISWDTVEFPESFLGREDKSTDELLHAKYMKNLSLNLID